MAFTRPTLTELVDRIQQDFVSRLPLAGAVLRRSMVYVLARIMAGAAHMLHGHLEWLALQLFADTAERAYLLRMGRLYGMTPTAATFATGTVTLTGTNATVVPAGTVLLSPDGYEYTTNADATISSGTATAAVTASLAGATYTLTVGLQLSFESPVSGADSTATVASSVADGNDEETTEAFRIRFLARLRTTPQGGAEADYVAWAKEVAGVTRAWVYPSESGAGTVTVRFMRDNDVDPIPSAGEVTTVQAYIDALRPVTATLTVSAPVAAPLAFTIAVTPNTTAVKAAVTAELEDLLLREAEPGVTLELWRIRQAIGSASGLTSYTLTSPAADVTHTVSQIPTLGTITWA